MPYTAKHKFADMTPRKMRPFADLIRGRNVDDALEQLRFYPNRGARLIEKVLKSAIGNAEDRGCQHLDGLIVSEARIDCGPTFKRIRPRARGTAFQILRRMAHIVIAVEEAPIDEYMDEASRAQITEVSEALNAIAPAPRVVESSAAPTEKPAPASGPAPEPTATTESAPTEDETKKPADQ